MSTECVYKVSCNSKNSKYYEIRGELNNENFKFYRKNWKKCRLIKGEATDIIKVSNGSLFSSILSLNYLGSDKLEDLMIFPLNNSSYKVVTNYWSYIKINWTWGPSKLIPKYFALIDESNGQQILAQMEGFSLNGEEVGTLFISENIPNELRLVIFTTACLIWKLKHDSRDKKENRINSMI